MAGKVPPGVLFMAPPPPLDPQALLYKRVRDAILEDGPSNAERVAVLEMVKFELLANMHLEIQQNG